MISVGTVVNKITKLTENVEPMPSTSSENSVTPIKVIGPFGSLADFPEINTNLGKVQSVVHLNEWLSETKNTQYEIYLV